MGDSGSQSVGRGLFRQIGDRSLSLDERIVDELRSLITTGQLKPGDRLPSERELAHAFHVSRTSLREALRRLATMGLVEIRWGQGVFVRANDLDFVLGHLVPLMLGHGNVAELYEVRRLLEVAAAGWAAERASEAEREELRALTAQGAAERDGLASSANAARDFDRRYHNLIAALGHNAVLMRVMVSLLDLLADLRGRSFAIPGRALHSLDEHGRITEAILSGDAPAARREMLGHLHNAEEAVFGALGGREGSTDDPER